MSIACVERASERYLEIVIIERSAKAVRPLILAKRAAACA